ncbi:MAG TPA: hypothetical protein VFU46_14505 [Gemmatimonadales bacterium]|nr:hypothetical protein [Gemmatimonadales bacterium]
MRWPIPPGLAGMAVVLAACGGPKPPAPSHTLPPAADTLRAPFQDAAGAVWLGSGRWAVVSEGSAVVGLADFGAGRLGPLGGPKSDVLRNPFAVFRAAGDTLWVADWGLRRVTGWVLPDRLVVTVAATSATRGALPRARDAAGQFYLSLPAPAGRDGSGARDSGAVVRASSDLARIDTVARLTPPDLAEVRGEAGRRFERRVFSGEDAWGVLPNGSVWVARVHPNRVDWYGPDGERTEGELLPDRVLEVTRADRELFVRSFPPELRRTVEGLPYAAIKPPFETGFTSADGLVWLQKSKAAFDTLGSYQLVDRRGKLLREIRVPATSRILAASADAALAVEADSAGLRLLQYPVPAITESRSP